LVIALPFAAEARPVTRTASGSVEPARAVNVFVDAFQLPSTTLPAGTIVPYVAVGMLAVEMVCAAETISVVESVPEV